MTIRFGTALTAALLSTTIAGCAMHPGARSASTDAETVAPQNVGLASRAMAALVGSSRVDLQACKLEYSIVSPK